MAQNPQSTTVPPLQVFDADFEKRTYKKIIWRLMPFLFMCYIFAYVDRVNVGFAALNMKKDLGMSDAVFGNGSGIFFGATCYSRCRAIWRCKKSGRGDGWARS